MNRSTSSFPLHLNISSQTLNKVEEWNQKKEP